MEKFPHTCPSPRDESSEIRLGSQEYSKDRTGWRKNRIQTLNRDYFWVAVLLQVWSLDQWHWLHLGTC